MVKRVAIGIFYIPLYHVVLYPLALLIGVVLFALNALYTLIMGNEAEWNALISSAVWDHASGNMRWLWTGEGSFNWVPF